MTTTAELEMVDAKVIKTSWIGQSAAEHHSMMKVQRLAERRSFKRSEMRGSDNA